jgi:hypothetical protein
LGLGTANPIQFHFTNQNNIMKKIIFAFGLVCAMLFSASLFAQPGLGGCNEGRAQGAAHANATFQACFTAWQGPGIWDVDVYVNATPGKDGCTYEVEAWACPACHGVNPCPKVACIRIAKAYLDANFNVWLVESVCM